MLTSLVIWKILLVILWEGRIAMGKIRFFKLKYSMCDCLFKGQRELSVFRLRMVMLNVRQLFTP